LNPNTGPRSSVCSEKLTVKKRAIENRFSPWLSPISPNLWDKTSNPNFTIASSDDEVKSQFSSMSKTDVWSLQSEGIPHEKHTWQTGNKSHSRLLLPKPQPQTDEILWDTNMTGNHHRAAIMTGNHPRECVEFDMNKSRLWKNDDRSIHEWKRKCGHKVRRSEYIPNMERVPSEADGHCRRRQLRTNVDDRMNRGLLCRSCGKRTVESPRMEYRMFQTPSLNSRSNQSYGSPSQNSSMIGNPRRAYCTSSRPSRASNLGSGSSQTSCIYRGPCHSYVDNQRQHVHNVYE